MANQYSYPSNQGVVGGATPSQQVVQGSGGLQIPCAVGNYYVATTLNSTTGTNAQLMVTGAPGYYLTDIVVTLDPTLTIGTAGMINVTLTDSAYGTVFTTRAYVPASFTAPTQPTIIRITTAPGFFFNNKNANSTLSASISVAPTAGSVRVSARYGICSYVG